MSRYVKFSLSFFLIFQAYLVNGQLVVGDSIFGKNNQVKPGKSDTLLVLGYSHWDARLLDTISALHVAPLSGIEYLLYKKGDKIYSRKSVGYFTKDFSNSLSANSDLLEITEDSIFTFVHKWLSRIAKEKIKPYIYQRETLDTINPTYEVMQVSHPSVFFVGVFTAADDISRDIDLTELDERHDPTWPVNLNYKTNTNTKLFLLYQALMELTSRIDKKYVFQNNEKSNHLNRQE